MKTTFALLALAGFLMTIALGCGAGYVERERVRRQDPREERHEERVEEHHDR